MSEVSIGGGKSLQKRKSRIALGIRLFVFLTVVFCYVILGNVKSSDSKDYVERWHPRTLLSINESEIALTTTEAPLDMNETTTTYFTMDANSTSSTVDVVENVALQMNCTLPAIDQFPPDGFTRSQRKQGAFIIHIFLTCYCFWLLAAICDDYFVPSVEVMCYSLQMKEDVVGATFMAAATSSPELFINCIGTFITKGDIGVGTIVGSAVFNILAVPACCGLFAGQVVYLDWWPVSRDCLMYCLAVFGLIATLYDGIIMWYEGLILTIGYFLYMFAMYCNDAMARKARKLVAKCRHRTKVRPFKEVTEISPLLECNGNGIKIANGNGHTINGLANGHKSTASFDTISTDSDSSDFADDPWRQRDNNFCTFLLKWPITFALWATIPDCRKRPSLPLLTFILSIVWIGITSYIVAFLITIIGEFCTIKVNSKPGICKLITDCISVIQDFKAGRLTHSRCGFENRLEIVCCPTEQSQTTASPPPVINENSPISQQKCHEYADAVYQYESSLVQIPGAPRKIEKLNKCGHTVEPLIVGGKKAKPREFPHMALLGYDIGEDRMSWSCGGSLISDQFVLTAAHCLNTEDRKLKVVHLGDLNIARDDDDARPETFRVADYIINPERTPDSKYHDIGLVKVDRKIKLTPYIRPACLPTEFDGPEHRAIATGWGNIKYEGKYSDDLLKVTLDKVTHEECRANHPSERRLKNGIDDRTQICAGSRNESKDACQGDSGGPLQTYHQYEYCMYSVIGVTSFGINCGVSPGVYTRVYPYVNWIEKQVWGEK